MFLCAAPECDEAGTVFVVITDQETDTDTAPAGRLFCVVHADEEHSGITKFQPEE